MSEIIIAIIVTFGISVALYMHYKYYKEAVSESNKRLAEEWHRRISAEYELAKALDKINKLKGKK